MLSEAQKLNIITCLVISLGLSFVLLAFGPVEATGLNLIACSAVSFSLLFVLLALTPLEPSMLYFDSQEADQLPATDLNDVPERVIQDAWHEAKRLYGSKADAVKGFACQLIETYKAASRVDTLILFNPGGFGWSLAKDSPGWKTVIAGIMQELSALNREVLAIDYRRTRPNLAGIINEALAFWWLNPLKSRELALRVAFLTRHIPEVRVIIAGESNGCNIVERTIRKLKDNNRVYAIQTGPLPLQRCINFERSLVTRHNGRHSDSLSTGNIFAVIWANLKTLMGIEQEHPGKFLLRFGAPGHHYSWEYEGFRDKVTGFLKRHLA